MKIKENLTHNDDDETTIGAIEELKKMVKTKRNLKDKVLGKEPQKKIK